MAVRVQQLKAELEARLAEEARIDAEQQQYGAEMEALEKQIAEVNARIATKTKTKTKKSGGRRGSVEVLDLAPLREGGCRARSWNKGQGTQCPRQALDGQFFCKGCQAKDDDACLPCGCYDEPRPNFWHETDLGANSATKIKEDNRKGMPWKMDDATYQRQFATIFGEQNADVVEVEEVKERVVVATPVEQVDIPALAKAIVGRIIQRALDTAQAPLSVEEDMDKFATLQSSSDDCETCSDSDDEFGSDLDAC